MGKSKVLGGADAQPAGGPADLSPCGSQPVGAHQAQGGWIEWAGGECPVDAGVAILIQFRCETREEAEVHPPEIGIFFRWSHRGTPGDIIAYREAQP